LDRVYSDEAKHYSDNAVDLLAERVRAKIEPHPKKPIYLLTVLRKGYRLVKTDCDTA
jgi:DNA-binding response OmpR family regulator